MANGHYVIPKLVEDASLKRARTEVEIDGEKKDVIRVLPAGGAGLDAQGVADAMALAPSESVPASGSVLKNLELAAIYTEAISRDTLSIKSDVGSLNYTLGGDILDKLNYSESSLSNINTTTGTRSDAAWSGSGNATIIALLKGIYNKL